jgi:hypothetical protein
MKSNKNYVITLIPIINNLRVKYIMSDSPFISGFVFLVDNKLVI